MKHIKLCLLLAAAVMLFTACSDDAPDSPVISETGMKESVPLKEDFPLPDSSAEAVDDDTLAPEEGMVRSPLTNEWVDADVARERPIAVMIPSESAALPHYSLSKASVIYEANVEGRMTRMLAVFEDWDELEKIGNVRSLRTYYAYWALEWDAFIVHWGGPFFVDEVLEKPDVDHLDGMISPDDSGFFQTEDRAAPHNSYASGPDLKAAALQKGYSLTYRGLADKQHYRFATKAEPNTLSQYPEAQSAAKIDMSGCYPMTRCYFKYNEEDGLYYRYQHISGSTDGPHIDAVTGEQLTFKNILVQYAKYEELGDGYLAFQVHDTTEDGWFFTNGKGIHVTWEKTSDFGATRYYDDNGDEITLNTGKTMVMIVEKGDSFSFE